MPGVTQFKTPFTLSVSVPVIVITRPVPVASKLNVPLMVTFTTLGGFTFTVTRCPALIVMLSPANGTAPPQTAVLFQLPDATVTLFAA